jgi:magnesium-transporting ATPase (P-type)
MTLGLSLSAFTTLHVVISLIGIASGLAVVWGMLSAQKPGGWTALFLATTVLTSVTGLMFPFNGLLPSHVVGAISLVLLALALLALYVFRLAGAWRWVYVATALAALYLNVFVGVVQAFQKLAFLQALAPTQSAPPFAAAQGAVLVVFLGLGWLVLRRFKPVQGGAG